MNVFSYSRRLAQGALLLCLLLAGATHLQAQCGDFQSEPQPPTAPVDVTLNLTNGGAAQLDESVLLTLGFTAIMPPCTYEVSTTSNFAVTSTLPAFFFCGDISNNPNVLYLRVNGPNGPSNAFGNFRELRITVLDQVNPTFPLPLANAAFNTSADGVTGDCAYTDNGSLDITPFIEVEDNCNISEIRYYIDANYPAGSYYSTLAGVDFPPGVTTVTVVAYDDSGNSGVDDFTVTVTDDETPQRSAACPHLLTITVPADAGLCSFNSGTYAGSPNIFDPTVLFTDNCGVVSYEYMLGPGAFVGTPITGPLSNVFAVTDPYTSTAVRFRAYDAQGNFINCRFDLQPEDNQVPVYAATPADVTLYTDDNAAPSLCYFDDYSFNYPSVTDNCGIDLYEYMISGATAIGWTASVGNPSPIIVDMNVGTNVIHFRTTDIHGNTSVTSYNVTVVDNEAPVVMAAGQIFVAPISATDCSKVITFTRPDITALIGDCGPVTMQEVVISGPDLGVLAPPAVPAFNTVTGGGSVTAQFPAGTTKVAYYWIDNAMNFDSVHYTFIVQDTVKPIAKCKNLTLSLNAQGKAYVTPALADNGSTDNCPLGVILNVGTSNMNVGVNVANDTLTYECAELLSNPNPFVLTIKDASGNSSSANCTVTIVDNMLPTVVCPADVTVNTGVNNCTATGITAGSTLVATDNCTVASITWTANNGASPASGSGSSISGVVFQKGTTDVVYTVTDNSGNVQVCNNFQVFVVDQVTPKATGCPAATINLPVNTIGCSHIPGAPLWNVTWTDNCTASNLLIVTTTGGTPTSPFPQGETTISITATDQAGNVGTCSFVVDVFETTPPMAVCQDVTVNLNTPTTVTAVMVNNGSSDNCTLIGPSNLVLVGGNVNVTSSSCANIPVTLKVTDRDGNMATCNATIIVNDNIAPTCVTKNATIFLDAAGNATLGVAAINNGSSDNCSLAATPFAISKTLAGLADNSQTLTYTCSDLGANTVFFKVTDQKGNTCTSQATVTVVDNIVPVGNGPSDIAVECDEVTAYLAQPVTITAVENCSFTVSGPTETISPLTNPTCGNHYNVTRSWIVTDASGNTDLVQQVVTVFDNTAPAVSVSAATGTAQGTNHYQIKYSDDPMFSYYGDCYPTGTYTIAATDNCGGALTTTWVVEFDNDGYGPYADLTGSGNTVTAQFVTGDNFITYTTIDGCGNATETTVRVTVIDDVKPIFDSYYQPASSNTYCGQQFVFNNTQNTCGYTFQWVRPWDGDLLECNDAVLQWSSEQISAQTPTGSQTLVANFPWDPTNSLTSFVPVSILLPVGTSTFTYKVTDNENNTQTCSFTVKVNDTQTPTLSGPTATVLNTICPTQTIGDYTGLVTVTDNCGQNITVPLTQTPPANTPISALTFITPNTPTPNPYDGSQFVVTVTATDGTNISLPRNITVTLDDNTAPVPSSNTLPDVSSNCGYIILMTPTALPNCTAGSLIYGTPGGVAATAETFNGPNITSYRVILPNGSPCSTYFVTWSYNDGNGNVSTQLQKVTLCPDVIAPTALCKNATITLSPSTATLTTADINNGSFDTDNCNPFTLSLSKTNFTCADVSPNNTGSTTVTLTATASNNPSLSTSCTAMVKVIDNIAPTIDALSVPANITVDTCAIGYVPPAAANVTATDNCSATVSLVQTSTQGTSGSTKYNYVITRTWTAKDVFGNSTTAVQTITVRDVKKPVFTTPSAASLMFNTAAVTTNCSATAKFNVAAFVSDCAPDGELSIVVNPAYFSLVDSTEVLPVGSHTVNFTVTDPSGNSATASFTIVIKDATKPIASCINGISVALNANGQAIVTPGLINNQSSDNCGPVTLQVQELELTNGDTIGTPANQLVFDCDEADNDTQYPIILWVLDASGNFNFCETYVVIQDNVAPTIVCPANVTIECSNDPDDFLPAALGTATVSDNCPANVTTTYTDVPVSPGYVCGNKTRTFMAADLSGNTATCVQTINVEDTKPPVFSTLPQNDTISCDNPLVVAPVLTANDNCTPSDSISITLLEVKSDSVGVCGKYNYKVTRTWTAKDKCGNVTTHTQTVKVEDKTAPVFLGMPDTINILTASFPPSTNCTAPVALNAEQYFSDCATLNESTINSITFSPTFTPAISPVKLNVSGDYPVGSTKVFFSVTDPCGNAGKDSVVIKVVDNSAPVVICNNSVEISLSNNGLATLSANDINLNSFDNCGIDTITLSKTQFDCEDLGVNNVTMTVTDINGNSNSCTVGVEVTAGPNTGFTLTTTNTSPTYFGGANGSATATVSGGSNTFSFAWSTSATTASVTGLAAGTYTLTVTDLFTGCKQSVTITVADGPMVSFNVGDASGAQNTVVKVPVTVDNFQQISGFTFSLFLDNPAIGTIVTPVAVTNINPALSSGLQVSVSGGNTASVLFLDPQGANINLPNGSVLFNLCVQLSGAPLGTMSNVNLTASPVQFTILRTTTNGPITVPGNSTDGTVQITQGLNEYDILGDIYPWQNPAVGVPNVDVDLTGPATPLTFLTAADGEYGFNNIIANTNTLTAASKSQAGNAKIDIIDQGLLLKHIFATSASPSPLTSPYQRVAADVNFDGQINIIDFALIQRLLLGTVTNLEGASAKDWVFIPKSYTFPANATTPFPNPVYPALPVFPQTIDHTPLFQDQLDDDFVGVRMGDLNGDAPLNFKQGETEERDGGTMNINLQDRSVKTGETVKIAFKAKDFTNRYGYQFTLAFDPNVFELQNIEAGAVPGLDANGNFGTALVGDGLISTAWVSLDAATINDDETMFALEFKAISDVNTLTQVFSLTNEIVEPMSINTFGEIDNVALNFIGEVSGTQTAISEHVLYQNQPNPFQSNTVIGFRLPSAERCVVKVFASNGRLVKTYIGEYEKGYNAIQVRKSDLGGTGVYYYELSTPSFSDRKKMLLID